MTRLGKKERIWEVDPHPEPIPFKPEEVEEGEPDRELRPEGDPAPQKRREKVGAPD